MNRNILETYQIYITGDGSPTLYFSRDTDNYVEKMHNAKGAYAESLYIYGDALDMTLGWPIPWHEHPLTIGSLGLGLAYNEIISVARIIKKQNSSEATIPFRLISFEKDPALTQELTQWLNDEATLLAEHYQWILERTATDHSIETKELKLALKTAVQQNHWQIRGEFPRQVTDKDLFHIFYYDAFSNKMSPELWTDEVLDQFIRNHTAPSSLISTYAATGAMKRALKNNQFKLQERPGFGGKRESILGIR